MAGQTSDAGLFERPPHEHLSEVTAVLPRGPHVVRWVEPIGGVLGGLGGGGSAGHCSLDG